MQNDLICPKCKKPLYFSLDEWGRTPWHLHCDFCHINIGATKQQKAVELIQKYNKKDTYLEYYDNDIQVLWEEGKFEDLIEKINAVGNINLISANELKEVINNAK